MPFGIDIAAIRRVYSIIADKCPENVTNSLANATEALLHNLCPVVMTFTEHAQLAQMVVLLEKPLMLEYEHQATLTQKMYECLHGLSDGMNEMLVQILVVMGPNGLERQVDVVQQFITVRLYAEQKIDKFVV